MNNKKEINIKKIIKSKKTVIITVVVVMMLGVLAVYADDIVTYFSSTFVGYDNTSSGLQSTNVKGAIDELYGHATDYTEVKSIIGDDSLDTTNQTLTGGINELNDKIENYLNNYTVTVKTGTEMYSGMYYANVDIPSGVDIDDIVSVQVVGTASNRPAYITRAGSIYRVWSNFSELEVNVRYFFI